MYAILVKATDSENEVLLPQKDEYPGSSPWFTEMSGALEVAAQVIGLGLSSDDDDTKIASARVVRLSALEAPEAAEVHKAMTRLVIKTRDGREVVLAQTDDKYKTTVNSSLSDYSDRKLSKSLWSAVIEVIWHANQSTDPKYVMKPANSWTEFGFKKGEGR